MYFRVRETLNYGVGEWDALPWWQQIMYVRQIEVAAAEQQSGEVETEGNLTDELVYRAQTEPSSGQSGVGTVEGTADNLRHLGINVVRAQFGGGQ